MREAFNQFLVIVTLVIGTLSQLPVDALDIGLQLMDVRKGLFSLLHHRTAIGQLHHLRQVADSTIAWHRNHALRRLLQACQDFQHGRLACTILTHQRNAVFLVDYIRNIFKQRSSVEFNFESFYGYHNNRVL